MNKTLKVEIELQVDTSHMKSLLLDIRQKLIGIENMSGVNLVTVWEFNRDRGIWLTYGWGFGEGSTELWMPLKKE